MTGSPDLSIDRRGLLVAGVSHRFGAIVAARDITLAVQPGEVHCLLGPSGSGKSTLLRLIAGLEKLQAGSISIAGQTVGDGEVHRPPEARSVGFVFQDYALFPHLDARRNVAFGMRAGTRQEKLRAAEGWLEKVGLAGHARAMPHTLSGGQQQRVALVRALATEPGVMLLDEPFSGLDEQLRGEIREMTVELLRGAGVATLMITHDPREALTVGDRVSVIRAGQILQTGTPAEVYHRSASRRVAEVFGPVNALAAVASDGRVPSPWGDLAAQAEDGTPLEGDVEILIRTDALRLSRTGQAADGPTAPGRILAVSSVGALANVRLDVAGRTVEVQELSRDGWQVGEEVEVGLESGAARVLPAAQPEI